MFYFKLNKVELKIIISILYYYKNNLHINIKLFKFFLLNCLFFV